MENPDHVIRSSGNPAFPECRFLAGRKSGGRVERGFTSGSMDDKNWPLEKWRQKFMIPSAFFVENLYFRINFDFGKAGESEELMVRIPGAEVLKIYSVFQLFHRFPKITKKKNWSRHGNSSRFGQTSDWTDLFLIERKRREPDAKGAASLLGGKWRLN